MIMYVWDLGEIDLLYLAEATSILSFLIWAQMFQWMRLFKNISFYVLMIIQIMYDIRHFMIMLLLCVATFSNSILILDLAGKTAANC
jgi:hypothetical protein